MTAAPRAFFRAPGSDGPLTSARVEVAGAHERLTIWVRGASVGSLTLGPGEGAEVAIAMGFVEGVPSMPLLLRGAVPVEQMTEQQRARRDEPTGGDGA